VLASAAYVLGSFGEDLGAATSLMDRCLALNPGFARGWYWSGVLRLFAGQPVLNSGVQQLRVDVDKLAFQGGTYVETNAIADFVFLIFQLGIGRQCKGRKDKRGGDNEKRSFHNKYLG
jgi:hypothetical protein